MDKTANPEGKESLGQRLFNSMTKSKNKVAQIIPDTGERDTLGDMLTRAVRVAIKLQSFGIGPEDIISSCLPNNKNSCIPFLATLFIGAKPATLHPSLPVSDITFLLNKIQPKVMFVALEYLDLIESCLKKANISTQLVVFGKHNKYPSFDDFLDKSPNEDLFCPASVKDTKDTAIILFSSGTTGFPKGICISHQSILSRSFFDSIDETLKDTQGILLSYSPIYWIAGVGFLIKSILDAEISVTRVVGSQFDPKLFWVYLEQFKVDFIFMAPYQLSDALQYKPSKIDCSHLKLVLLGGCLVTKTLMEGLFKNFPNSIILNCYGMTEAFGPIACFDPSNPENIELMRQKPQCVGKILPFIDWKVIDPDSGKAVGPNQKGKLFVKSERFMNGYYKQDSSDVFDSEGYMKTGDVVYFDEDNCLFIGERAGEMFKYRGWHIMPSFLEGILLNHPAVEEAVVIGVPNERDENHPMAVVVLKRNCVAKTDEIAEFVNSQVPDTQKLRAGVKIIDKLPRTATGKLKRSDIQSMIFSKYDRNGRC